MADQERRVYSFSSVGETESDFNDRFRDPNEDVPIGIKTPMELCTNAGSLFEMHTEILKVVRDNFRNMLATNHGERFMLNDFGANLLPLAFELGSETIDAQALRNITATTQKYMPYIMLETFEPLRFNSDSGDLAQIGIRVGFSIPALGVTDQAIETIIYAVG